MANLGTEFYNKFLEEATNIGRQDIIGHPLVNQMVSSIAHALRRVEETEAIYARENHLETATITNNILSLIENRNYLPPFAIPAIGSIELNPSALGDIVDFYNELSTPENNQSKDLSNRFELITPKYIYPLDTKKGGLKTSFVFLVTDATDTVTSTENIPFKQIIDSELFFVEDMQTDINFKNQIETSFLQPNSIVHNLTVPEGTEFQIEGTTVTTTEEKTIKITQIADGTNNIILADNKINVEQYAVERTDTDDIEQVKEAGGINANGQQYYEIPFDIDLFSTSNIKIVCCNDVTGWEYNNNFISSRTTNRIYDIVFKDGGYKIRFGDGRNGLIPTNNAVYDADPHYFYAEGLIFAIFISKTKGEEFYAIATDKARLGSSNIGAGNDTLKSNIYSTENSQNENFDNAFQSTPNESFNNRIYSLVKTIFDEGFQVTNSGISGGKKQDNINNLRNQAGNHYLYSDRVLVNNDYQTYIEQFTKPIFYKILGRTRRDRT